MYFGMNELLRLSQLMQKFQNNIFLYMHMNILIVNFCGIRLRKVFFLIRSKKLISQNPFIRIRALTVARTVWYHFRNLLICDLFTSTHLWLSHSDSKWCTIVMATLTVIRAMITISNQRISNNRGIACCDNNNLILSIAQTIYYSHMRYLNMIGVLVIPHTHFVTPSPLLML